MKRVFDFSVAAFLLIVLAPVIFLTALSVRMLVGAPVLFRQVRSGRGGQPFTLYKFRTMTDERAADGVLLDDSVRLTAFGKFLRASSLDELPALWNVLLGEMSLVGPRPLLPEYLELYTVRQARRNEVMPGVTGWAQVNGRNALSWEKRLELDVWYVENQSFWIDLKILGMTVLKVIQREGITQLGHATMERFKGSQ